NRNDFGLELDPAALDAIAPAHRHKIGNRLAAKDHAADHPIERAIRQELIFSAWEHPGDVTKLVAAGLGLLHPLHEFVDVADPDTELDEVKRHLLVLHSFRRPNYATFSAGGKH